MRKLIVSLGVVGIMLAGTAGPALAANPHKKDHARQLCQKEGGTYIRVDNLVYACVLPTGATEKDIRQAARECKKQGGALFAAVGNVVYACVLPGGHLSDLIGHVPGAVPDPLDVNGVLIDGLRLFPIVLA